VVEALQRLRVARRDDGDLRLGELEAVLQLVVREAPVLRRDDRAELGGGEFELDIFRPVLGEHRDDVPPADAHGRQGMGEPIDPRVDLGIGPSPRAVLERYRIGPNPHLLAQKTAHGGDRCAPDECLSVVRRSHGRLPL